MEEVANGTKEICYGLGVGFGKEGVERYMSDETELMIGVCNGSKITTTGQETHPRTGKKMRKAKIVSLIEQGGKKIQDPYGNWHDIPTKAEFKINSFRNRGIEIKEIK